MKQFGSKSAMRSTFREFYKGLSFLHCSLQGPLWVFSLNFYFETLVHPQMNQLRGMVCSLAN